MESSVYAALSGAGAVTAIAGQRVYVGHVKQAESLPALTYERVSTTPNPTLGANNPTTSARCQVDAWAETYAEARALADAARVAVLTLTAVWLNEMYQYEPDVGVHHISIDFSVWFST